jgi:hypothetical protein
MQWEWARETEGKMSLLSKTYLTLFQKFRVTEADRKMYEDKISSAKTFDDMEGVIRHFHRNYVRKVDVQFQNMIIDCLNISLSTQLLNKQVYNIENGFIVSSTVYEKTIKENYRIIAAMIARKGVELVGGNKLLGKDLADKLIDEFNYRITGAMANTRSDVLKYVRTLQREMIIRNKQLLLASESGVLESVIEAEKAMFKENMLKKYPRLEKMLKEGKILKSRSWINKQGEERFRNYTLDEYTEMATSETLLNVDRDAVEYVATAYNETVVEFYLRDNRDVEVPNPPCEHIINLKTFGKSLLATSEYAAKALKLWSIDRAKAEHSLEISRHCRHSIRRAPEEILEKCRKLINIATMSDQVNRAGEERGNA